MVWFAIDLGAHYPNNVLSWDVYGAYLHLPANFIYDDPFLTDWSWIDAMNEKYNSTPSYYQFWYADTGNQVIKYPLGFAIIYLPFFVLGHLFAYLGGYPMDGFSQPYQHVIVLGHLIYVILGFWMARKVLLKLFNDQIVALLLLMLFAGTNFLFTTTIMVAMPHGHLFLFYSLILWFTMQWHEKPSLKNSIYLGLFISIAALIRATEILAILIPILWQVNNLNELKSKWQRIKNERRQILVIVSLIIFLGSIQLIYYKLATGHFFIDAYKNAGEGFDFLSPHTFDFLISARKGWFIYTPIMLFSFIGLRLMWKNKNPLFFALFIFTVTNIYVLSSWTCWWYAESFGQRSMVQSYLILMIPIGYFLNSVFQKGRAKQITIGTIIGIFIFLNVFQTWQLHNGLIHPSRMTADAYWAHFLKTNQNLAFENLLLVNKDVPAATRLENEQAQLKEKNIGSWHIKNELWQRSSSSKLSDTLGFYLEGDIEFSPDIVLDYTQVTKQKNVILKIRASFYYEGDLAAIKPTLVLKMRHRGKPYYDQYLELEKTENMVAHQWNEVEIICYSADVRNMQSDEIQIFAWKRGQGNFSIDFIHFSVYEGLR